MSPLHTLLSSQLQNTKCRGHMRCDTCLSPGPGQVPGSGILKGCTRDPGFSPPAPSLLLWGVSRGPTPNPGLLTPSERAQGHPIKAWALQSFLLATRGHRTGEGAEALEEPVASRRHGRLPSFTLLWHCRAGGRSREGRGRCLSERQASGASVPWASAAGAGSLQWNGDRSPPGK